MLSPLIKISIASFLMGIIPLIVRYSNLDAYNLSFWRIMVASIILLLILKIKKKEFVIPWKNKKILLLCLFYSLTILFSFWAVKLITVSTSSFLLELGLIYFIILSHIYLGESLSKKQLIGVFLAFIGLLILLYNSEFKFSTGLIVGIISGISMGLYFYISKTIIEEIDRISLTYYQNIISVPFLIPFVITTSPIINLKEISLILILSGLCTVLAFFLLLSSIKEVKSYKYSLIRLLSLIIPIIGALFIFSEIPKINEIIGGLIMITAFLIIK